MLIHFKKNALVKRLSCPVQRKKTQVCLAMAQEETQPGQFTCLERVKEDVEGMEERVWFEPTTG
tara:strand:+ start:520 stop:711 length:192 start_codon:yes stop_codon:yes gene_type:complete